MIKQLKQILVTIARIPPSDQRWIVRRLTTEQLATFNQWQGLTLLQDAQRFRKLKLKRIDTSPNPLPDYCKQLTTKAPLYTAIILEQGSYSWHSVFLKRFDKNGVVKALLDNQVGNIKPSVKQALWNEWENSLSFEMHLDTING